jgi:hypothetical protein
MRSLAILDCDCSIADWFIKRRISEMACSQPIGGLIPRNRRWVLRSGSKTFYKSRSQEKTHPLRLEFFLLRSPLERTRSVLTCRGMRSVAGRCGPAVWIFSTSGFHRSFATKPISSETSKAERWSGGDHGSIRDSWPIAFSGCPRGPRVEMRLGARGPQRLTT